MSEYEQTMESLFPQIEELRRQGQRFDLQGLELNWEDLVDDQIDREASCTIDIKDVPELQVREIK